MPFSIRTHTRLEVLAATWLAEQAEKPLPPLTEELVLLQSLSLRGWLEDATARALGVASGLRCTTPRGLLRLLGGEEERGSDPWDRDALRWRLDPLLDAHRGDPAFAAPAAWLAGVDERARLQFLERLADVFDTYQLLRPDWLAAWEKNRLVIKHPHEAWQAALWRDLRRQPGPHAGERVRQLIAALRSGRELKLPVRLTVFGVSGLPRLLLDLLAALGARIPVTLWVAVPATGYWGHLRSRREQAREQARSPALAAHADEGHPLLANLGAQGRDWFNLLQEIDHDGAAWEELPGPAASEGASVLARLQNDIIAIAELPPPGAEHDGERQAAPAALPGDDTANPPDRSLSFHRCHSALREVEVARDEVLRAFAELPGLRPEEVLLLCPDLPAYAPLVEAVFARPLAPGRAGLHVTVVDRPARETDPVARLLLALLRLAGSRCTRSELLALFQEPALRAALGLDEAASEALAEAVARAGIRFGLDQAHRRRLGLPEDDRGTWRWGLDRLAAAWLAGPDAALTAASGRFFAAEGRVDLAVLAGPLDWLRRLCAHLTRWQEPAPLATWAERLRAGLDDLLGTGDLDASDVCAAIDDCARGTTVHGCQRPWPSGALADTIATALEQGGSAPWRGTGMAFAGFKPLRSIPARVIVLLGMDDQRFPRRNRPAAFDLMAEQPRPGDRAPREDDRQLFLETLLAARARLAITWTGRDQRSDEARPWSVCCEELAMAIDRTWRPAAGRLYHYGAKSSFLPKISCRSGTGGAGGEAPCNNSAQPGGAENRTFGSGYAGLCSARLLVEHPLQPFSPRCFVTTAASFDAPAAATAAALQAPRIMGAPFAKVEKATAPSAAAPAMAPPEDLDLEEVVSFWRHPAKAWLKRLGVSLPDDESPEGEDDDEPFALVGLDDYLGRQALAEARWEGDENIREQLLAGTRMPAGLLGQHALAGLDEEIDDLLERVGKPPVGERPVGTLDLANGRRLSLRFPPPGEQGPVWWRAARIKGKDRLAASIHHLAWNAWCLATKNTLPRTSRLVGSDAAITLKPIDTPWEQLAVLIEQRQRGLEAPLPFFPESAWEMCDQMEKKGKSDGEVLDWIRESKVWIGDEWFDISGDRDDVWVKLAWRDRDPFAEAGVCDLARRVWRGWALATEDIPAAQPAPTPTADKVAGKGGTRGKKR